jgi:hypothetical protein
MRENLILLIIIIFLLTACRGTAAEVDQTPEISQRSWSDVPYTPADIPFQRLDVYLPETGDGPFPTLLAIHGVAFWHNDLYVASTEQGIIVRIPILPNGSAGEPEVVAGDADCDPALTGLDSVDGIAMDVHGDIIAALVIQNKMVKVDMDTGEVTELLNEDDGLHNPASVAFGTGRKMRHTVFFTNFALIPPGPPSTLGPAVLGYRVGVPGLPLP